MKRMTAIGWWAAFLAGAAAACTDVEFGSRAETIEDTKVQVQVDWRADTARPADGLYVAMSRILRSVHYLWTVDADGAVHVLDSTDFDTEEGGASLPGFEEGGDPFEPVAGKAAAADSTAADSTVLSGLPEVEPGDYYVMAFNLDTALYAVDGMRDFLADASYSMRDLRLQAREMDDAAVAAFVGNSHADFNPSYAYIRDSGPLFLDVMKETFAEGAVKSLRLEPERLTQRIAIRFRLELEEGVEVERITGEISGVAGEVELMSGTVDDSVTYRSLFEAAEVSREGQVSLYEGVVNVLGLFPGKDDSFITGPGILQLSIRARSGEYERVFHAGINLKETITRAGLMNALPGDAGFRTAREEAELQVESLLRIRNDQVEPGGEGQGVENWFNSDNIDVEL